MKIAEREMEELSMKKRVGLLVMLLALTVMGFAMNVEAAEIIDRGYCGGEGDGTNLTWTFDSDGVLVIEGQGMMKDWIWEESDPESYYYQPTDWHKHNGEIYSVIIRNGIIKIGSYAFYDCESLSSINLPESLTGIGDDAFGNCSDLSSIKLPESLTSIGNGAFANCSNFNSINLPESLTSIGNGAFSQCFNLSSVKLPESLTSIGEGAFWWCSSLSSINLPESLTSIGEGVFVNCSNLSSIKLPESLTSIGADAFFECDSLSSIVIPESVTSIGYRAFQGCSNLSSIKLPGSLTSIGIGAFRYCSNLRSISLPESLTSIEAEVFLSCKSLSSIVLPEMLTSIGYCAFYSCESLRSIDLPESLTIIEDDAFYGCESLSSIVIPESVTTIEDGLFRNCPNLSSVNLPKSVTSIGEWAFGYCFGLSSINLPESVTSIGKGAFHSCSNLSSIKLPEMLTSIGERAFEDCYKLSNIVLPESLTSIGYGAFQYCFNLGSIYIPVSVDTIYRDKFAYAKLTDIYYGGTKEQWKNIGIDDRWYSGNIGYDALLYATIHYADDDYQKLNDFVSRLYINFLKREPDEKGLADWVDVLRFGKGTGAKVVAGFVLSPEYQANSLSNEEYVTALYQVIFDRKPDAAGLNAWVAVLENGYSIKKVLAGFVNSEEFENLCRDLGIARSIYKPDEAVDKSNKTAAFVARLYKVCLGRAYEEDGLDNWVRALTSGTVDIYSVVREFFNSEEFENRNLDDTEFVTVAYQTILDRKPDASGLKSWTDALDRGYTRNRILDGFLKSTEFANLCAEYGIKR